MRLSPFLPLARPDQRLAASVMNAYGDPLVKAYCMARFLIIHQRFLNELLQFMPREGRVLEIGCGFGLFALYFASMHEKLHISGVDLNPQRIGLAQAAAQKLGRENVHFMQGDARTLHLSEQYDAIYMLDILHHLPPAEVPRLLREVKAHLKKGGVLLVKDVDTRPWHKMAFTWALDVLMTGGELPHYLPSVEVVSQLKQIGFQVFTHDMVDLLPYPHRLYFCLNGGLEGLTGAQEQG